MAAPVLSDVNRRVGVHTVRVATCLIAALSGGCGATELPQHVLDARRPNVTAPRYISEARSPNGNSTTLLLFVHGVFGDTVNSWTRPNSPSLPAYVLQRPEFGTEFDAFAFGFASSTVKPGSFRIPEAAAALAREVEFRQFLSRYRRIVIVAHSMGGLVALEMLTTFPKVRAKVPLVVTYGTPYDGAQVARLGALLDNPAVNDMLPRDDGNTFLLSLANRWREARSAVSAATRVMCAYETVPLPTVGLIVPSASSSSLCDGVASAIAEDHIGLVKPDSAEHESVKVLTNALRTLATGAPATPPVVGERRNEPETAPASPPKLTQAPPQSAGASSPAASQTSSACPALPSAAPVVDDSHDNLEFKLGEVVGRLRTITATVWITNTGSTRLVMIAQAGGSYGGPVARILDECGDAYTSSRVTVAKQNLGAEVPAGARVALVAEFDNLPMSQGIPRIRQLQRLSLPLWSPNRHIVEFANVDVGTR